MCQLILYLVLTKVQKAQYTTHRQDSHIYGVLACEVKMLKKMLLNFLLGKDQASWRWQTNLVSCSDQRPKVTVHTVKPHTHSKLGSNKVKFKFEQGPLKFCQAKIQLSSSVPTHVSCTNHSTVHYTHSDTCYMQGINNWYSNVKKGFWSFWSVPTMYLTREPEFRGQSTDWTHKLQKSANFFFNFLSGKG